MPYTMDVPEKMIEALKRPARDCFRKETYNRYYKLLSS